MDVDAWLRGLGCGEYSDAFVENGVDASLLAELTNEDLKDLGVARLADRKQILRAIEELDSADTESGAQASRGMAFSGEYRQVTALFADLSGFTQLSNTLGAEQTHALLNHYFEVVDGIIEGYGGTVDKHIGDAVMAVFGAPVAHTNDPERAAMAALDIHAAMGAIDPALQVHVGIASGQVVASGTGSDLQREYTVIGDSVNLASRLTDLADPGETLISNAVRTAIACRFVGKSLGPKEMKGLDGLVAVWRLEDLAAKECGQEHRFVGRRRELRQIKSAVEGCLESGLGQSIYIRGEAGIGKTRLVEEAQLIAEEFGFETHTGLVIDFGVGKGQDAIRSLVRSLLGLPLASGKALRSDAANRAVSEELVSLSQHLHLNDLLDLEQPAEFKSIHDAMDTRTRNRGEQETLATLVRSRSSAAPVLLKVEDIHWANRAVLSHLSHLAAAVAEFSALLLMTSRIEGDPLDQAWRSTTAGAPITTIDLGPLRAVEALELAQEFEGVSDLSAEACMARAGGNPLFLEQLLRNAEAITEDIIPGSIQGIVQARMDDLPTRDRRALQAASVLGQRFTLDALRHLLSDSSYRPNVLVAHHLARPLDEALLFSHALIREGAYASLLQKQRQALHEMAADWYVNRDAVLHAEHLDKAGNPSAAIGYLTAAQSLATRNQFERAAELAEKGLACATENDSRHALLCLQGDLLRDLGDISASIAAFAAAIELDTDEVAECTAWVGLAFSQRLAERYDDAFSSLRKAEAYAAGSDLAKELAQIYYHRASISFRSGDLGGCLTQSERALREAQRAASPENEARALSVLGDAYYMQGQMIMANKHYDRCVVQCRANGYGRIEVANLHMRGLTRYFQLDLDGALSDSDRSARIAAAVGQHRAEMIALGILGGIYLEMANLDAAEEAFQKALDKARYLGAKSYEPFSFASLARIRFARGLHAEGLELARDAVAVSREVGLQTSGPRALSVLALITNDAVERHEALQEGQELLNQGCISHHYIAFYRDAMEGALSRQEYDELERYAGLLEDYMESEPAPLTDFFIARGRALAAAGRGKSDRAVLAAVRRLKEQAERRGLRMALPALEATLSGLSRRA